MNKHLIFFLITAIDDKVNAENYLDNESDSTFDKDNLVSELMRECYERNSFRFQGGYRYNKDLKLFLAYNRMLSGKLAYETFKANAKHSIPSLKTIDRYIARIKSTAIEGVLRIDELWKYLTDQNLPLYVSISEDQTKITGRVQYDPKTNKIVGFVLPLSKVNGMPITSGNIARSASAIEHCFYNVNTGDEIKPAQYVNAIMAQPLVKGIPAFCLSIFGSDGTFTSEDVHRRWKYIIVELKKKNIEVVNISTDSDPRLNSAMRKCLNLGQTNSFGPLWFNVNLTCDYYTTQDTIHIATKFRNRMFNRKMQFGKNIISIDHLIKLIRMFPKTKHNLCPSIVETNDRQNFESVLRICDDRVISLLSSSVKDSEGTIMYLRIISNITKSFLDETLTPLERIRHIWFSNFLLRIWRAFILQRGNKYSLEKHFVSNNAYVCVEINAHSLVMIMLYLKKENMDSLFLTTLFGSQPCEGEFRQIRSLSSTYSTVTNCSVLEIIQRLSKIELQNEISHITLKHFAFPRIGRPTRSYYPKIDRNGVHESDKSHIIPSEDDIYKEINLARLEASEYAESLGISLAKPNDFACTLPISKVGSGRDIVENNDPIETVPQLNNVPDVDPDILQMFREINLSEYSCKNINMEEINEESVYVKVRNTKGEVFYVTKHILCWLLSKSTTKLSSDRLRRVMAKRS